MTNHSILQSPARRLVIGVALTLCAVAAPGRAAEDCDPASSRRAQQDVQALSAALYSGDVDTVLKFTHPKVVQLQGGPAAARQVIDKVMAGIQKSRMSVESLTFPSPPTCLAGGGRRFIVVPTLSVLSLGGQRFESLNYQFGVAEPGETSWTYVEGSRVNQATVQVLFPGFPKQYTFPPIYRKPI